MALNALGRHLALIGFMGAGKTTIAPRIAERLGRRVLRGKLRRDRPDGRGRLSRLRRRRGRVEAAPGQQADRDRTHSERRAHSFSVRKNPSSIIG